jgi:ABC-type transport system involved in cytochrome bd biosynthesis fused ATPase/permease subunit
MKVLRISFLSSLALEIIATLSVALIAVSIGLRLVGGSLSLRTGLFVLICSPEVYWPIRQVALYFHAAADGVEAAKRIFGILEEKEINGAAKIEVVTEINWQPLTVTYPDREIVSIPAGRLQSGTVNCIVGPSGAGKSTLLSVLLGFHSDYSGEINVIGTKASHLLSDLEVTTWRSHISWLPQEVNFPAASVAEVLRHSAPNASQADLVRTLARVGLTPNDLPNGLDTQLGTVQEALSTGQKRKIGLARALLKPAQILILDEPSASVDDISEDDIARAIAEEAALGKIVVLVSHRTNLVGESAVIDFGARR